MRTGMFQRLGHYFPVTATLANVAAAVDPFEKSLSWLLTIPNVDGQALRQGFYANLKDEMRSNRTIAVQQDPPPVPAPALHLDSQ